MNLKNKLILISIIYLLVMSCSSSDRKTRKIIFYTEDNSVIEVTEFQFKTHKGGLYFHVKDEVKEDNIINKAIINKIDFICKDTIYHCLPYDLLSSAPINSTFKFAVMKKSKEIQYFTLDKRKWFLIGLDEQIKLLQ